MTSFSLTSTGPSPLDSIIPHAIGCQLYNTTDIMNPFSLSQVVLKATWTQITTHHAGDGSPSTIALTLDHSHKQYIPQNKREYFRTR